VGYFPAYRLALRFERDLLHGNPPPAAQHNYFRAAKNLHEEAQGVVGEQP